MSNSFRRKHSRGAAPTQRQLEVKQPGPLERIKTLEEALKGLLQVMIEQEKKHAQRIGDMEERTNALIRLAGPQRVMDEMDAAVVEQGVKSVQVALAEGRLVKAETIAENSVVVGYEIDSKGVKCRPGRIQFAVKDLTEAARKAVVGQGVGGSYEAPEIGRKMVFEEIYEVVPKAMDAKTAAEVTGSPELAAATETNLDEKGQIQAEEQETTRPAPAPEQV